MAELSQMPTLQTPAWFSMWPQGLHYNYICDAGAAGASGAGVCDRTVAGEICVLHRPSYGHKKGVIAWPRHPAPDSNPMQASQTRQRLCLQSACVIAHGLRSFCHV